MEALISHLQSRCKWLNGLKLSNGQSSFEVPLWLRLTAQAVQASAQRPIVLVLPNVPQAARWTALICSLEAFRSDFDLQVLDFCGAPPELSTRVIISPEKKFYHYEGVTPEGHTRLKCMDGNILMVKLSPLRIKVQTTGGSQGKIDSLRRCPSSHPYADLLGCDPMGNPELLGAGVVLIDSKSGSKDFVDTATIGKNALPGALRDFDPTCRLIRVHRTALEFVDSQPPRGQTIIINGARRLDTLAELDQLVGKHRLVIFASPDELDHVKRLQSNADFWFLTDDQWLADGNDPASVQIRHLAVPDWSPKLAINALIESAAAQIGQFCSLLVETDDSPAQPLRGAAWGLLLEAASRTRGYNENQQRAFKAQVELFRQSVAKVVQFLTPEMQHSVNESVRLLTEVSSSQGATNAKGSLLFKLIGASAHIAIITRTASEALSVRDRHLSTSPGLHVFSQTELPLSACYDVVVVCGWLGARAMTQLFTSGMSQRIVLIGYAFEVAWLRSLLSRLARREGIEVANTNTKLEIVSAPETITEWPACSKPPPIQWPEIPTTPPIAQDVTPTPWADIDIWDFEYRITHQRKEPRADAGIVPVTDPVSARYVSFQGTGYAFFTTDRKVPVISEMVRNSEQAIQPKAVADLKAGDLVIFPHLGGSDIIAQVADKLLGGNAEQLRMQSEQYQRQLQSSRLTPQQFLDKAKPLGLNRSLATVRQWYDGNRVIGPDSDADIEIIQRALGHTQWAAVCINARGKLRQAHGTAEVRIKQALMQKLAQSLDQIEACGCQLDLGDIGWIWVQCVASVGDTDEHQSKSRTNRLLGMD